MKIFKALVGLLACLTTTSVNAATKEQWRGRSMYQIVTDRFAQPTPEQALTDGLVANCDPKGATWCGGNWRSIIDKLDYIRDMGFTAIWISPVNQNIDVSTPHGSAIHGYWVNDVTKLNARFGTSNDLKALIQAAHEKGIYVMVDIVINHVATLPKGKTTVKDMVEQDPLMMYRDEASYHNPYCRIKDWGKKEEYRTCSLGDDKVALVDVDTESPSVQSTLNSWINGFVTEYAIDGLRIDAAKHMEPSSMQKFCQAAGVMCMGEVYTLSAADGKTYTDGFIDSIHSYPLYEGFKKAFIPGSQTTLSVQSLLDKLGEQQYYVKDTTVWGTFIGNHDNARWYASNQDLLIGQNAFVFALMVEGIPTVYYGDEQELAYGMDDPDNRQALWSTIGGIGSATYPTEKLAYQTIKRVNQIRGYLSTSSDFDTQLAKPITPKGSATEAALQRGKAVFVITNRGSGSTEGSLTVPKTSFNGSAVDMLTCTAFEVSSEGSIVVSFASGGKPFVFLSAENAAASGICPELPGSASTTVSASAAVSTISLSTSAAETGKSVLPAATTSSGEVIVAMPSDVKHGSSAIVETTEGSASPNDGATSDTPSDGSVAQPTQVSASAGQASSTGAVTGSMGAAPEASKVQDNSSTVAGNDAPSATTAGGIIGASSSPIDSRPGASAPADPKDPIVTSIGSGHSNAVQVSFLWSTVMMVLAYQGLLWL